MDSDADRSQILANFQACTNIEDIGLALGILEEADWNLSDAVQRAMGDPMEEDTAGASGYTADGGVVGPSLGVVGRGMDETGRFAPLSSSTARPDFDFQQPQPQREVIDEMGVRRRLINFTADYNNDRLVQVSLPDTLTVFELKQRLATELDMSAGAFSMLWQDQRITASDTNLLRELNLPRENSLLLLPMEETDNTAPVDSHTIISQPSDAPIITPSASTSSRLSNGTLTASINNQFRLNVLVRCEGRYERKEITVPGSSSVKDAKNQFRNLTGISLSDQQWDGWPMHVTDDMIIAACGLTLPVHNFTLTELERSYQPTGAASTSKTTKSSQPSRTTVTIHSDSDEEESQHDDYHMSDTDILDIDSIPSTSSSSRKHLIPANTTDPTAALNHFNVEFKNRYSTTTHPIFFIGSLQEAITEALNVSPRERRLLAVYLHHDSSIASNVFCSQVLCSETIVNYLTANFLTWAWDLTLDSNRRKFQEMWESVIGRSAATLYRRLTVDQLPLLIVVAKVRGSLEILATCSATVTSDELMTTLLQADDEFQQQRSVEVQEENDRREREEVKRLQDAAYEESLAADRIKEKQRLDEQKEKLELLEQQRQEEELKEVMKQSLAATIPKEPPADCKHTMARLRFRCPNGEMKSRRFLGSVSLRILLDYLVTLGYSREDFKVLTTFPRRDLTQQDEESTLDDLKLCPQETLILEAR